MNIMCWKSKCGLRVQGQIVALVYCALVLYLDIRCHVGVGFNVCGSGFPVHDVDLLDDMFGHLAAVHETRMAGEVSVHFAQSVCQYSRWYAALVRYVC